jgi:hypothetical protein
MLNPRLVSASLILGSRSTMSRAMGAVALGQSRLQRSKLIHGRYPIRPQIDDDAKGLGLIVIYGRDRGLPREISSCSEIFDNFLGRLDELNPGKVGVGRKQATMGEDVPDREQLFFIKRVERMGRSSHCLWAAGHGCKDDCRPHRRAKALDDVTDASRPLHEFLH